MPIVRGSTILEPDSAAVNRVIAQHDHPLHSTVPEILKAAFLENNLSTNIVRWFARSEQYVPTGYDPYKAPEFKQWTEMFPEEFEDVFSREHAEAVTERLQENIENRRILQSSGGVGMVAGLSALVIDPTNLIPVGWIGGAFRGGAIAAKATIAAKMGGLLSDDAVRLGVRLTEAEKLTLQAVKDGNPIAASSRAANLNLLLTKQFDDAISAELQGAKTLEAAESKLEKLRKAGWTDEELARFYRQKTDEAVLAGRAPPTVPTSLSEAVTEEAGDFVLRATQKAGATKATNEQYLAFYANSIDDAVRSGRTPKFIDKKKPTQKDLKQFYDNEVDEAVRAGRTPPPLPPPTSIVGPVRTAMASADDLVRREIADTAPTAAPTKAELREFQARSVREDVAVGRRPQFEPLAVEEAIGEVVSATEALKQAGAVSTAKAEQVTRIRGLIDRQRLRGERHTLRAERAHDATMVKLAEHNKALAAARKAASEGLPNPIDMVSAGVKEGALVGSVFGGFSEVIMQAVQEGREDDLVGSSFLAGGILGGLLGGFGGALAGISQRRLNSVHIALVEDLTAGDMFTRMADEAKLAREDVPRGASPAVVTEAAIEKVKARSRPAAALLERAGSPLRKALSLITMSPAGRLAHGISDVAADWVRMVMPLPYLGRGTLGPSAMARMIGHSQVAMLLGDRLWRMRGSMDWKSFSRAIADTVRSGKPHAVAAVNEGANELRRYWKDWVKQLQKEGLLKDVDLGADVDYFPRLWDYDAMRDRPSEFVDAIQRYVGGRDNAEAIRREMLVHRYDPSNPFDMTQETGRVMARELKNVPSEAVGNFLYDDIRYVLQTYSHQVGSQLEIARLQKTGSAVDRLNMTEWRKAVLDDLERLAREAKTDKQRKYIEDQIPKVLRDFDYIQKSVLGFIRRDPFDAGARAITRTMTTAASFMYLGNAGFHSLGDMMAPAFVNGARSFFRVSWARTRELLKQEAKGMEKRDLTRAAWLYQWLGGEHSRTGMFFDFLNDHGNAPKEYGGILRKTHNSWMAVNLLRPITAFANEQATYVAIDKLLNASRKLADGVAPSRHERSIMELSGLDDVTAAKIGRELKDNPEAFSGEDGVMLPILSKWKDQELAETFRAAVIQNTHLSVLNPVKGELPILLNNPIGQILLQFLSYPIGATQSFMISGLQRHDAAVVAGSMMMIGVGMFTVALDKLARGEDIPEFQDLVAEGFERSGVPGVFSNLNHLTSRLSEGVVDYNNLLGAKSVMERYGPVKNFSDSIPGFSAMDDIASLARQSFRLLNGEPVTDREIDTFSRRLGPMRANHLAPIRMALEEVLK